MPPGPGNLIRAVALSGLLSAAACQLGFRATPPYPGPTPLPLPEASPAPATQVTFTVRTPSETPEGSELALVLLDEVTGFAFNRRTIPMHLLSTGVWSTAVELAYGALQYYRYELVAPPTPERDADGSSLPARVALIQASLQVEDVIAGWGDPSAQTPAGSVFGRLSDTGGLPLAEQIVVLAGRWAFTDAEGAFAFRGIPAGLQRLTAFSPEGTYRPAQQGVQVAADGLTPVQLSLERTALAQVTFEVTVPADTVPGGPLRIAGNLQQLGQRFADLPGGVRVASQAMPAMTRVDDTHYLWIGQLPIGLHLRYKYTLGDGLWNAERSPEGFFNLREATIPAAELQLRDTVSSWRGQHGSVLMQVTAPENTPAGDSLSIQLNPAAGFAPLPMQRLGDRDWFFVLHGPLDLAAPLTYRYCRNLRCGPGDEAAAAQASPTGRQVALDARGTNVQDTIEAWAWWPGPAVGGGVGAPEIQPRADLEVGVELAPGFHPDWLPGLRQAILDLGAGGANAVVLRPGWSVQRAVPLPLVALDPSRAPFAGELLGLMELARGAGLAVSLRPTLIYPTGDPAAWWAAAPQGEEWWNAWFSAYRSFALRFAELAQQGGAGRLVLGGPEAAPFLPGSPKADGQPDIPADAEGRWRGLIAEIRSRYSGRLAFELEVGRDLPVAPPFLQEFDELMLYWHAPLGERPDLSLTEMRGQAAQLLDLLLDLPELSSLPILLSVGYPALDGGAGPCAAPAGSECQGPSTRAGQLPVDLQEQAWAVNAMLLEVYTRPQLRGFFARGYDPLVASQDYGISAFGKPAAEVLWYWFARLSGAVGS